MVVPSDWQPQTSSSTQAESNDPERRELAKEDRERFRRLIDSRRRIGYGVALTAFGLLAGLGAYSFIHLRELAGESYASLPTRSFWLLVGGHAVVTVAFVFLGYQLLRAAERLILPYWWAESNPELARLMLGMGDPLSTAAQTAERTIAVVERVADPILNLAQRISATATGRTSNGSDSAS